MLFVHLLELWQVDSFRFVWDIWQKFDPGMSGKICRQGIGVLICVLWVLFSTCQVMGILFCTNNTDRGSYLALLQCSLFCILRLQVKPETCLNLCPLFGPSIREIYYPPTPSVRFLLHIPFVFGGHKGIWTMNLPPIHGTSVPEQIPAMTRSSCKCSWLRDF